MAEEVQAEQTQTEEVVDTRSTILDEAETKEALGEQTEEVEAGLPSDEVAFEVPDKFKGKSAEEIAKAYVELEKMKNKEPEKSTEETKDTPEDKIVDPKTNLTEGSVREYISEYQENGKLSEESYQALIDKGYTKELIDEQIDFYQYQQEKAVNKILEPHGTVEDFKAASDWARENWTPEQVEKVNKQLSSGKPEVVDAVLTGLFSAYNQSKQIAPELNLHTNQPQTQERVKGYETKSDYLKDANDKRYETDAKFRKKVEAKMALTDLNSWY